MTKKILITLAALLPLAAMQPVSGQIITPENFNSTDPVVHDPVMAKEGDTYYIFSTNIQEISSKDLKNWKLEAPVKTDFKWISKYVPHFRGWSWAPDILYYQGKWHMFYASSAGGRNTSAIGHMTRSTLDTGSKEKWKDCGEIIHSAPMQNNWNAIDPNVIIAEDGTPWLSYGSFWDGIQLVQLSKDLSRTDGTPRTIARHLPGTPEMSADPGENTIEAPFIFHHGDYYYLFVSWDYCCRAEKSTYRVMVGRSKSVEGPYLDRTGKDMAEGGGTLVAHDNATYVASGHNSVYNFDGKDYYVSHGYRRDDGSFHLILKEMDWDWEGWPIVDIDKPKPAPLSKVIDNGGSGDYPAIAISQPPMEDYVIYRPGDLAYAAKTEGKLPVMIFANGGCNNTSLTHERVLSEIASQGYIVIALGPMQRKLTDRKIVKAPDSMMTEALDWILKENADPESEYYQTIDTEAIAFGGQSCGGAQVINMSKDPRVKTSVMFNSGIGDMSMDGATKADLTNFHGPVLYIIGDDEDVAYQNALKDYDNITSVPVAFANLTDGGHMGTFAEPNGGSFARMCLDWLDWQLKGRKSHSVVFLNYQLDNYPGWTMKSKGFRPLYKITEYTKKPLEVTSSGKKLWGEVYMPECEGKRPLVILCHGYNSWEGETRPYADALAKRGIACVTFEFCGGSTRSRSEGESVDMSVFTEASDVEAIMAAAKGWDFVDQDKITVLGCSQGGLVASIVGAQNPSRVHSLILVYPALQIGYDAVNRHPKEAIHSERFNLMGLDISHVFYDKLIGYDIYKAVEAYKGPATFIYGDRDDVTAHNMVGRAKEAFTNPEFHVIARGTHGFGEPSRLQKAIAFAVDFMGE